jgi:hypothetical protein
MAVVKSVGAALARMRAIAGDPEAPHGAAVFNRMYLTVTEEIDERLSKSSGSRSFRDPDAVVELDVRFANLWLSTYDVGAGGGRAPSAWRPVFESSAERRLPIQFAIAGMNAHIEHDLPIAVVETCRSRGLEPDQLHDDYEAVNSVLASVEAQVRRSFLDETGRDLTEDVDPVLHLLSAWNIDKARDVAWVTVETLWALRGIGFLKDRFLDGLGHTVGMASRTLLTPLG